jgi:hypothetical protein
MGLDITAYKNIKLVDVLDDMELWEERYDWKTTTYIHPVYVDDVHFIEQLEDSSLQSGGVYEFEEQYNFRAGSYSGYNAFRDWLSQWALGVSAREVWNNAEEYKDKPFYLLINFSDCEGYIAGSAVNKLLEDFVSHEDEMRKHAESLTSDIQEWYLSRYEAWRQAFELASNNGYVEFH